MAAQNTDKLRKGVAQWSGVIGSGGVNDGSVTTIPLSSVSGIPTDTAVMITINRVDTLGKITGNFEGVVGVISGTNVIDCLRGVEGTAQAWLAGTVVEILFTADNWNDLIDAFLVAFNQDGTIKNSTVLTTPVINGSFTGTAKAASGDITTGTADNLIVTPKGLKDAGLTVTPTSTTTFTNKTLDTPLFQGNVDGWISANETWTYASATTITVPSGAAAKYAKGDKIKITQTTVKYFYIVGVADTVLTVTGGSDYTVVNAAISANYYSHENSPIGFPQWFNYLVTWSNLTKGSATIVSRFSMNGKTVNCMGSINLAADSSVSGSIKMSFPVTAVSTLYFTSFATILHNSQWQTAVWLQTGSEMTLFCLKSDGTYLTMLDSSATAPVTWANTSRVIWNFSYEAA